jgi:hypothetical protein
MNILAQPLTFDVPAAQSTMPPTQSTTPQPLTVPQTPK